MTGRITKSIIKVSIIILVGSMIVILGVLYDYFIGNQFLEQNDNLNIVTSGVEYNGLEYLKTLKMDKYRITWIDKDGTVLYDSKADISQMENHYNREEFQEAVKGEIGESKRTSSTLSESTLYSAKKIQDGTVIRISTNQLTVLSLVVSMIWPMLIVLFVAIIFAYLYSSRIARKTVAPINNLDLENPFANDVYDELSPLLSRINYQNKEIKGQLERLEQKNNEITYIMENVTDGIVLLNEKGYVVSANKVAKNLLSCEDEMYFLDFFRNLDFQNIITEALKGKSLSQSIKIGSKIYIFSASFTDLEDKQFSVFLFIRDITEEEKTLKMRKQFSANVSHELKTPLTTIMGTAEIMANGIVKKEDIKEFAGNIYNESSRLLKLIQDIIKISRLDEKDSGYKFEKINLSKICKEVKSELLNKANKIKVKLEIETGTEQVYINGVERVLYEMIYNLCDNALTYNKKGGTVTVKILKQDEEIKLIVFDTGIGVAEKHLPYIFERFYRVDKSRSKETGGTGLGLSIVKNGAELHEAKVEIESEVNKGTKITIIFDNKKNIAC